MPGFNGPVDDYFFGLLKNIEARLRQIATQQQGGVTNAEGDLVCQWGLLSSGQLGIEILDSNGIVRVQLGQLPSGDYGLYVGDPNGASDEILPSYSAFNANALNVTAGSYTATSGTPSVTAYLGASGDAKISISSQITGANGFGLVGLSIDGGTALNALEAGVSGSGSNPPWCSSASLVVKLSQLKGSTLTPNTTHTFTCEQTVTNTGIGATFEYNSLIVEPI